MVKQGGLATYLWVDGNDLSGDINAINSISGGPALLDFTGINKSARERQGGRRDGQLSAAVFFNPAALAAHPVLDTLPRTDRILTYLTGSTVGAPAACLNAKQINYDGQRADDGSLPLTVAAQGNAYGLEWAALATASQRIDSAATNGSGIDNGASSAFGLQAYLHVFTVTGTSVTVKLQHSNDNAGTDPYADITGAAFAAATTSHTAQRIATAAGVTVKRWIRVVTTGTFSSAVFGVAVNRNPVAVVF
jgi:hypothetical protein